MEQSRRPSQAKRDLRDLRERAGAAGLLAEELECRRKEAQVPKEALRFRERMQIQTGPREETGWKGL